MTNIMEKIAGLLAKTVENGASTHEAIEAAKMAQRLMAKYQIDAVQFEERTEEVGEDCRDITRNWQMSLATIVAMNTCCRAVQSSTSRGYGRRRGSIVMFFGRESDRKNAVKMWEMFYQLIQAGIRKARQEAMEYYGSTRNVETAYSMKYIQAIQEELGQQCRALALVTPEDVNDYVAHKFTKLRQKSVRYSLSGAAGMAGKMGYADGKRAASRKRLEG